MSQSLTPVSHARARNLVYVGLFSVALTACGGGSIDDAPPPTSASPVQSALTTGQAPSAAPATAPPSSQKVLSTIQTSSDYKTQLTQLYMDVLRRAPDPGGLAYWEGEMNRGKSLADVERAFKMSPEYRNLPQQDTRAAAGRVNYYVDANVPSEGDGSLARPFKSILRAAAAVTEAGTTVWVLPGTYTGSIVTKADGRNNAPIVWISTQKWGAKIVPPKVGENNHSKDTTAWFNQGPHVHIIGFEINGSGSGKQWRNGIYTDGAYSVIRENHVSFIANKSDCGSGAGASGINLDSYQKDPGRRGKEMSAVANWVHDIGVPDTYCNKQVGIYFSTSGKAVNNIVHRSSGVGIGLWHDAHRVNITNNTVTGSMFGIAVGGGGFRHRREGANGVVVANNLLHDNYYGVDEEGMVGSDNVYRNNLVSSSKTPWNLTVGKHYNSLSGNPRFVSYARSLHFPNLNLLPGSPAIGAADRTFAPATDFNGKSRNATTGVDIGALEH